MPAFEDDSLPASAFYTGLVAELYEPLLGEPPRADDYVPFLERSGTPALELACGSGLPLLELLERGYAVEGLDASEDMLALCRARGAARGLAPVLYRAEMQSFRLERRYRSIFLAGASFTLLTSDADALAALACIHAHLEPGGHALIPLECEDPAVLERAVGCWREVEGEAGERLRFAMLGFDVDASGRNVAHRLRYERIPAAGGPSPMEAVESVERVWERRSWSQEAFRALVDASPFGEPVFLAPEGGRAEAEAPVFVALLTREAP